MSSEVELRNAATDLLSLLRDYMVVTSLTANDRFEEAVERLRVALSASPSIGRVGETPRVHLDCSRQRTSATTKSTTYSKPSVSRSGLRSRPSIVLTG